MLSDIDIVKLILGLKVKQLRKELGLSYQQVSDQTGLAISYLHSIEKGKKYPKADKIMALSKVLKTDFNYLVSLEGNKRLQPIVDLLRSDFLKIFPLETFGISTTKLLELLSDAPDKVNAFISTVIKVTRNYQLQGEDFYKAALRSLQDLQDNYFEDLEKAVKSFRVKFQLSKRIFESSEVLTKILKDYYQIHIDQVFLGKHGDLSRVRSYYSPTRKTLFINNNLSTGQVNFVLAKELAFQYLELKDRPYETRMVEVESFEKLLNNFYASYFAVALLLDEEEMVDVTLAMSSWTHWDSDKFVDFLEKYQVSSEVLIQRLANIFPKHFGIKDLFFLRFYTNTAARRFEVTKEMHLSQLHNPYANQLDEHYCRRWISIDLMRRLKNMQTIDNVSKPVADAQISHYYETGNSYLCISLAKSSHDIPENSTSVTLGLLVNDKLKKLFPFLKDANLIKRQVHTTCERCKLLDCESRAAPPVVVQLKHSRDKIKNILEGLNTALNEKEDKKLKFSDEKSN